MIRLLLSGLRFYWRDHMGVVLGTALAAAVLTGSLLVGDSVDGSLRASALRRLGSIGYAMHTPNRYFAADLAERVSDDAAAVLRLRGMALADGRQVNQAWVHGCGQDFWSFAGIEFQLGDGEAALSKKLAAALAVEVGDEVSLRVEKPGLLPRDAPLSAQKDDRSVRGRFKVARILGDDELGRFSLSASQVAPHNAFVKYAWLADRVELAGKANLMVAADDPSSTLSQVWAIDDFGLRFRREGGVTRLESDGIYLEPEAGRAALSIPGARGTLTYLVNSLSKADKATPYSFVLAMDGAGLAAGEVAVNQWLADQLAAGVGDSVAMKYFALLPNGAFEERERSFKVARIVPMAEMAPERALAPAFPGLTDVDRCSDWDVGIPMDEAALEDEANEAYWDAFGQTPKAIIPLADGREMWSNRFGALTGARWEKAGVAEAFRGAFSPAAAGYVFQPAREQALAAVENAMDFGQLFVGMSFFLIVASLMLTGLLFVFGVQRRAEEMGILLATGWRPRRARGLVLLEGGAVAAVGSGIGALLGIGYTKLLIVGLSGQWSGAIANAAIEFHGSVGTVAAGAAASFVCAMGAMSIAVWRQARHPARELLMADFSQACETAGRGPRRAVWCAALSAVGAAGLVAYALLAAPRSVTMPFFGAGALLLVAGVLACAAWLRAGRGDGGLERLGALAARNRTRRRARSLTVVGVLACGTFLVFAVSSMKEDVAAHADEPGSGTGGFAWYGESTLPISEALGNVRLRARDGDDASCLNLNRARTPRLLGVDPAVMSARSAFVTDDDVWRLLDADLPEGIVPALVGDADTAMWGLEARTGVETGDELDYVDAAGNSFKVRLVGHLPMRLSVFQGALLIAEKDFTERFPSEEGYRVFLMDEPVEGRRFERAGLDVAPSVERLLEFYAVESTYLAMFLVLGALGLAVGSLGMGVVVLRNVRDRRAELAALRAVGYRAATLRGLLFMEHGWLMAAGLAVGIGAAAVAMVPALFISKTQASPFFLLGVLAFVALCGIACVAIAVHAATRGDVLGGLRNE